MQSNKSLCGFSAIKLPDKNLTSCRYQVLQNSLKITTSLLSCARQLVGDYFINKKNNNNNTAQVLEIIILHPIRI